MSDLTILHSEPLPHLWELLITLIAVAYFPVDQKWRVVHTTECSAQYNAKTDVNFLRLNFVEKCVFYDI